MHCSGSRQHRTEAGSNSNTLRQQHSAIVIAGGVTLKQAASQYSGSRSHHAEAGSTELLLSSNNTEAGNGALQWQLVI
eukprot:scaffold78088_cov22-Tisochrysis_lutea.AAC.1